MPFSLGDSTMWLLYIWLGIMAALFLFLMVIIVRTSRIKTKKTPEPRYPEYDAAAARQAAESLAAAIGYSTISHTESAQRDYNQFVAFRRYLRSRYPLCHDRMEFEQVAAFSMLYCCKAAEPTAGPVLFCGHIDVVPAAGQWEYPPFEGRIEDGYVRGRGALEGKGNLICLFEALEGLFAAGAEPNRDIYIALGHDQEIGGEEGPRQIARILVSRGIHFDFILSGGNPISDSIFPIGCPVAEIGVLEKGRLHVRLSARGEGGDAARPPAHTSLGVLSEAICRVEFKPRSARLTPILRDTILALAPYLPYKYRMYIANQLIFKKKLLKLLCAESRSAALVRTTVTPVMAASGVAPDMLPERAEGILNIALLPGDTERMLLSWLTTLVGDLNMDAEVLLGTPPGRVSDYRCDVYHTLTRAIGDVFHEIPVVPAPCHAASDARHYEPLSGAVYRFSPFILTPDDIKGIHGSGERVAAASLGAAVQFYKRLLKRLCAMEPKPAELTGDILSESDNNQEPSEETLERQEESI